MLRWHGACTAIEAGEKAAIAKGDPLCVTATGKYLMAIEGRAGQA
jgi:hypothetical protein